ncbi:MAG: prepilin-type N-terminal cleavage/methylation domain-containing protein [Kofleriaceae bacterium]
MKRRGQRGFTLVELMVALAISSIFVMMVLSVFARMSTAYRRQQQVASLQVILAAAQNMISQDARQAGFQMAQGFKVAAAPADVQRPVQFTNDDVGPDELRLYAADATVQARVEPGGWSPSPAPNLEVDLDSNPFVDGELAVLVNSDTADVTVGGVSRKVSQFKACVVRVFLTGNALRLNLDTAPPWGSATNSHCDEVRDAHNSGPSQFQTMIYRFRPRAYRIDPARPALGVLQRSPSGTLVANDWEDLGIGFADLQVAARMFTSGDAVDEDGDGDPEYEWVSGAPLDGLTAANAAAAVTRLTVSLSARTDRSVDGVASAATPSFLGAGDPDYNDLGDHPSVALPNGDRIYRYSTSRLDMRNTGAGL